MDLDFWDQLMLRAVEKPPSAVSVYLSLRDELVLNHFLGQVIHCLQCTFISLLVYFLLRER